MGRILNALFTDVGDLAGEININKDLARLDKISSGKKLSRYARMRNNMLIGTGDINDVLKVDTELISVLKRVNDYTEKMHDTEEKLLSGLRRVRKEKEKFLENALRERIKLFNEWEVEARVLAQLAGGKRAAKASYMVAGIVPQLFLALFDITGRTGVELDRTIRGALKETATRWKIWRNRDKRAQAGSRYGIAHGEPAYPGQKVAEQKELDRLGVEFDKLMSEYDKGLHQMLSGLKSHISIEEAFGRRVRDWLERFNSWSLEVALAKRDEIARRFNTEESEKWRKLKVAEASYVLGLVTDMLASNNAVSVMSNDPVVDVLEFKQKVSEILKTGTR